MLPPIIGQICLLTASFTAEATLLNWNDTNFPTVKFDLRQPAEHLACVFGAIAVLIEEPSSQATTSPRLSLPSVECAAPSSWAGIRKPSQKPEKLTMSTCFPLAGGPVLFVIVMAALHPKPR